MKALVRKSVAGAEYWDTEEKRTIFVPKGMEPNFEVTANPKSMITPESQVVPATVIDANEVTRGFIQVDEGEEKQPDHKDEHENVGKAKGEQPDDLENKTVKELRAMAKKEGIDIPNAIRTKGDIINIIESAR